MSEKKTVKQCKLCPWRVGVDLRQIPGYSAEQHRDLACTIQEGVQSLGSPRVMACHHSPEEAPTPCAGWLAHQAGPGNNIGARLAISLGRLPVPEVDGPQHERFEDTFGAKWVARNVGVGSRRWRIVRRGPEGWHRPEELNARNGRPRRWASPEAAETVAERLNGCGREAAERDFGQFYEADGADAARENAQ